MVKPDTIFLDLDDVIADLRGRIADKLLQIGVSIPSDIWHSDKLYELAGMDYTTFWKFIDDDSHTFWSSLEFTEWGRELFEACKQIAPTIILTAPTLNPFSCCGKAQWIINNLQSDYLIGKPKWSCSSGNKLLIDDKPANCEEFVHFGGQAILLPREWNNGTGTPYDVIRTIKKLGASCAA